MENEKVYAMLFSKVYPLLVAKAVRKGRTQEAVDEIISWMTGYTKEQIQQEASGTITYGAFFQNAPSAKSQQKAGKGKYLRRETGTN